MKRDISKDSSWSETYKADGFELQACSDSHGQVYLCTPRADTDNDGNNQPGNSASFALRVEQLYQFRDLIDHAIRDLETTKRWPKRPVLRRQQK